ncbi:hypothetical protein [Robertmurraya massiliosenegalensis]|uniref:hypothetical protein n=1 Tax=Robertmurraya massiliosenegalensis TaxID=1287657 RepID=UPI0002D6AE4E|nr:hypothetical protein [Robertmurraya massiliosenegalensis]
MATSQPDKLNKRYNHELEENFTYTSETLEYLQSKLDEFDINCLKGVQEKSNTRGLRKTDFENYSSKRKLIDGSLNRLEAQGLIRIIPDGTFRPYFITIRGQQMLAVIDKQK